LSILGEKLIFRVDTLDMEVALAHMDGEGLTNSQVSDPRRGSDAQLFEAAIALSVGDGVPFTARDYQLLELLWRIDP
jgi:hypothetical protein